MSENAYAIEGRENRLKVGHLVIGLVFVGIAGSWALRAGGAIGDLAIGVLIPVVLVLAGVVGLVATVVGSRRRRRMPSTDASVEAYAGTPAEIPAEIPAEPTYTEPTYAGPTYADTDDQPHTEETAPIGSLPVDEPKEQT